MGCNNFYTYKLITMVRNIIIFCFLLTFTSCTDKWEQHYEDGRGPLEIVDKTVYEYLRDNAQDYSVFVTSLQATKADTVLQGGGRYTVWLTDELPIGMELESDSIQGLIMQNHVLPIEIQRTAFKDDLPMKTVDSKTLWLEDSSGIYSVNGHPITKTVAICTDGVIYDIDGALDRSVTLKESFWEDENYSIFRNILETYSDSVLVSVEEIIDPSTEEITYDSIFTSVISIFEKAKIDKDQTSLYTIFLTKNAQLKEKIEAYFRDVTSVTGEAIVKEDSVKLYNFLAESFIHAGALKEEEYDRYDNRYSVYRTLWKTSYQKISPRSLKKYSNGNAFEMETLFIPTNLIVTESPLISVSALYDIDRKYINVRINDKDVDISGQSINVGINENDTIQLTTEKDFTTNCLQVNSDLPPTENAPEYAFEMSWSTAIPELASTGELVSKEVAFTSGEYKVAFTYVITNNATQDFEVFINDQFFKRVAYSSNERFKPITVSLGRIQLESEGAAKPIKVTLKNFGKSWKRGLAPVSINFERTVNNY